MVLIKTEYKWTDLDWTDTEKKWVFVPQSRSLAAEKT